MADQSQQDFRAVLPPPLSLILIGVIPKPRDLEFARLLGWYRIPFRFAPKVVRVDYLAFYQPSTFGRGHSGMIETYAEVKGVELTTRAELIKNELGHPRANEEYFKIQLGPLASLPKPILSGKWKRITFLYTTGQLFFTAETIQDLVVRTEERKILWHSLREKASQTQEYYQEDIQEIAIDPEILMMLGDFNLSKEQQDWYKYI